MSCVAIDVFSLMSLARIAAVVSPCALASPCVSQKRPQFGKPIAFFFGRGELIEGLVLAALVLLSSECPALLGRSRRRVALVMPIPQYMASR